VIAIYKKMG